MSRRDRNDPIGYTSGGDDDRGRTPPSYRHERERERERDRGESPSREKLTRYNRRSSPGPPANGMNVNLNVEQMVSMVFEMRGTLAHEIEARRATEHALSDARAQIEALKDVSQRDNNKWSNLLGRVKELEVAGKLDTRLVEMNQRQEKFARNNDQGKLLQVFTEIKSRLDGQEREYRESLSKIAREQQRDTVRLEHDLRSSLDQQLLKLEGQKANDSELVNRLQARIIEMEKEFAIFMNAQVLMQQNINNKEKDGDWLKIYLTEQFNAQKHSVENTFKEMEHQMQRLAETTRIDVDKASDLFERKLVELSTELETERSGREVQGKKQTKALKQTIQTLSENLNKAVGVLDAKMATIKSTQNEAISNLHSLVESNYEKFQTHTNVMEDFIQIQTAQTAKEHALSKRVNDLEEVLKAEIKSRLKNHQKTKLLLTEVEKNFQTKIDTFKSGLEQRELERVKLEELQSKEEEEHARLLHIAMETRSILDSMVGQVEETHYVELRKNEWKAFGQVIELELKARDEEIDKKIAGSSVSTTAVEEKVDEVKSFVQQAFKEFEQHEQAMKIEEEEQAHMMHCAMESRAVLDSIVTHIVDLEESNVLALISQNIRVLDERTEEQSDRLKSLRQIVEAEHDATSSQLTQTHTEVMRLAAELASRVDTQAAQLEVLTTGANSIRTDLGEVETLLTRLHNDFTPLKIKVEEQSDTLELHKKDSTTFKNKFEDILDVNDQQSRDLKNLKLSLTDVEEKVSTLSQTQKAMQSSMSDQAIQSVQQRQELEQKLHSRVSEQTAQLSHSTAKIDELAVIIKRLDQSDRTQNELTLATEALQAKTVKLEQLFNSLTALLDDSTAATDKKVKDLRDKLEAEFEESEVGLKKLDKRVTGAIEELDRLAADFAQRSGGLSSSNKAAEEGIGELRNKVLALSGIVEKVESIRMEMKDLAAQQDSLLPTEKHQRDIKELQTNIHELENLQEKSLKLHKDSHMNLEDLQLKQYKEIQSRMTELDEKLAALKSSKSNKDKDGEDGGAESPRGNNGKLADISIVEKSIQAVSGELDLLRTKMKDNANQSEDNLNRVQQDLKKLTLKVESLESGSGPAGGHVASSGEVVEQKKGLNDLSFRVDALENEMKVKAVGSLEQKIQDVHAKIDSRTREVDGKLASQEAKLEKLETEQKRLTELNDEVDMKQNKRMKELQLAIDTESAKNVEIQNQFKAEISKQHIETDQAIKEAEGRANTQIKTLQKQVDQQEVDFKASSRAMDEKLHNMEWSLEYAKDEKFAADAKNIRGGNANANPHAQQGTNSHAPQQQQAHSSPAHPPQPEPSAHADPPSDSYKD